MSEATAGMQRGWKSCSSVIGELWVPSSWTERPAGTMATAYVGQERSGTESREGIVLSITDSAGSLLEDSSAALAGVLEMDAWSHVFSVSTWSRGVFRRRMQFVYEHGASTVAVSRSTATTTRGRIDLTCSAGFERQYDAFRLFDDIAAFSPLEGAGVDAVA